MTANIVDAIRACLPHASKEAHLKVLHGIRLHSGTAWATDRFTLARAHYAAENEHDLFVTLPVAKQILAAKSPAKSLTADGSLALDNGQTFQLSQMTDVGDHPNLARLFVEPNHDSPTVSRVAFSTANLDKFAAKHFPYTRANERKGHTLHLEYGANNTKPVRVTVPGLEWFTGLVVPIRVKEWQD